MSDALSLAQLHVMVWRATYKDYATPEAIEKLDEARRLPSWEKALSVDPPGVWVAMHASQLLGVVSYGPSSEPAFGGRVEIKHLYVAGVAQGRGLGRLLLGRALETCRAEGHAGVALDVVEQNEAARLFYEAMGGAEVGAFTDPGPLWRSDNVVVAWDFA